MIDDERIFADPAWLPHRIDVAAGTIGFLNVPRDAHRSATFLDDENLKGKEARHVRLDALPDAAPPRELHFIFHSGFCCSTLLARALDIPGLALALKEPAVLNDLAALGRSGRSVARLLPPLLRLLHRPFAAGEIVVVKPSNVANNLIDPIMTQRPDARALLLYAPIRTFLISVAKKGMWGRIWIRRFYALLHADPAFEPGFGRDELFSQTDLQIAALAWLHQQARFAAIIRRYGDRIRTLDSETLLGDRTNVLVALARQFGLCVDRAAAAEIASGRAFTEHSKRLGEAYDESRRAEENQAIEAAHGNELDMVVGWASAIAEQFSIPMRLGQPLDP